MTALRQDEYEKQKVFIFLFNASMTSDCLQGEKNT